MKIGSISKILLNFPFGMNFEGVKATESFVGKA